MNQQQVEVGKTFLEHHGVKGMKWGVRRSKRQLARAAKKSGGAKSAKDMSDAELRAVINRIDMERRYSTLTSQRSRASSGHNAVKAALATGATVNAAIAFARSPAGQAIRAGLSKASDTSAAVSTIGKF